MAEPYPGHAEHIQLSAAPLANTCTNANKATTEDEACDEPGNSAWNTITSARTGDPAKAQDPPYPGHALHMLMMQEINGYTLPEANTCVNTNKATAEDEPCDTPGNSAWNTITTARTGKPSEAMAEPYPAHALHLGLDGYTLPEANTCVNTNKATAEDEPCDTPGNSAWNTITSARTGKPENAMAEPYPAHTLH